MDTNLLLVIVGVALFAFLVLRPLLLGGPRVSAADARTRIEAGTAVLVDVREPGERRDGVAGPAALLPMSDLRGERRQWDDFLRRHREKELILYCASGLRSGMVARTLRRQGFNAVNLGGMRAWTRAGFPVRRP